VILIVAIGLLTWAGATVLLDAWWRRDRGPDLTERCGRLDCRFWPTTVSGG
jgi:hypothetical protein